jgi:hypothetical protein
MGRYPEPVTGLLKQFLEERATNIAKKIVYNVLTQYIHTALQYLLLKGELALGS